MASPAAARAVQTERGPGRAPVRATPAWAGVAGTPPRPRRPPAPRGPRRLSGPARGNARQLVRRGRHARSLILDLLSALERLSRHRLLERLIRGRSWIGLVAFALIGIVTLQLALLKLNASVGRALEHEASLQRENSALSIENSELASTDHVQARAAQLGMEFASSASLRFLSAHPGADLARAAAAGSPARSGSGSGAEAASASASPATGGETGSASGGEASATAAGEASSAPSEVSRTQPASSTGGSEQPASEASAGETSSGEAGASQRVAQPQSATSGSGAGASGSSASAEAAPAGGTQASPQG